MNETLNVEGKFEKEKIFTLESIKTKTSRKIFKGRYMNFMYNKTTNKVNNPHMCIDIREQQESYLKLNTY